MTARQHRITGGLLLAAVFAASAAPACRAASSVWRVESEDARIYLGGTIHLLRADDYPLPPAYDRAYADAEDLVFETNLAALTSAQFQARMMEAARLPEGETLKDLLSADTHAELVAYCDSVGAPLAMLEGYKPGLVAVTLLSLELQKLGIDQKGIDQYYFERGQEDEKLMNFLETPEEQLQMLTQLGEDQEDDLIRYFLLDLERLPTQMDSLMLMWREGDDAALADMMNAELAERFPGIFDLLLTDRNENWLPRIEAMLESPEIELVLVGAAHLVGEEGILAALESKGYTVTQLE